MIPASSDMLELKVEVGLDGYQVVGYCLICMKALGKITYLAQGLKLWTDHQEEERRARATSPA